MYNEMCFSGCCIGQNEEVSGRDLLRGTIEAFVWND